MGSSHRVAGWLLDAQPWASSAAYLLVVLGVVAVAPAVGHPLCLRVPAVTALGLVALLSLFGESLHLAPGWVVLFLGLLPFGYLTVEARNHGLDPRPAVCRAFHVWVLGLAHAVTVAAIVFAVLGPLLGQHALGGTAAERATALAFGAVAGLALGVFLQVLWDDRPVTAPLSHLRWSARA